MAQGFQIEVTTNTVALIAAIRECGKQYIHGAAVALTRTAAKAKDAAVDVMPKVFDRPTPYILNALESTRATKTNLKSEVRLKSSRGEAQQVLEPQVYGGQRKMRRMESSLDAFLRPGKDAKGGQIWQHPGQPVV